MEVEPAGRGSTDTYIDESSRDLWKAIEAIERLPNKYATNVAVRRQSRYSENVCEGRSVGGLCKGNGR